MKTFLKIICLIALWHPVHAAAATGTVTLVDPVVPAAPIPANLTENGDLSCSNGLVLAAEQQCCPAGTDNTIWQWACTPKGLIRKQLFKGPESALYCHDSDMYIVGNKKQQWFSCATGDSSPLYPDATTSEGQRFCSSHGYGFLIRISPWGTAGCVKVADSQGDGCIEAGSCSYISGK